MTKKEHIAAAARLRAEEKAAALDYGYPAPSVRAATLNVGGLTIAYVRVKHDGKPARYVRAGVAE